MEFDRRSPVYEQIVQYFKEQIASGKYSSGSKVPSRRELATEFKINPNTAQRAYKEMEEQGLIYTEGNSPSKVTEDLNKIKNLRVELIEGSLQDFIVLSKRLGLSIEEIIQLIQRKYEEEGRND
ncbi:GntR family transcriptional regulator [Jeotgalibaca caeni]|uniref:GntR family transcriptional regulator n=1 Tax=Jeotgalibaca caeni TaxID=3028623 RepID=UPI00237D456A|nr:GntR family transcriptional regulator [Jeotgalibaca caeni]MDE1550042.1 GntR family transcriptional regulator [Jeotgalibaca caeni]